MILDEGQNTSISQMKMFLTRMGEGSHVCVTGDPSQNDLAPGVRSGLVDAVQRLRSFDQVGVQEFTPDDVVRHPLVARIVRATHPDAAEAPDEVRRQVRHGASPRGAQACLWTARARALCAGRVHVTHEDLEAVARPALRHRLILSYEGVAAGASPDALIELALAASRP